MQLISQYFPYNSQEDRNKCKNHFLKKLETRWGTEKWEVRYIYMWISRIQSRRKWFNNMETSKALWWEYHLLAGSEFKGQEIWDLLFQEHNRANSCLLGGLMTPGWPLPEQCTTENILVHFATSAPDFVGLGILEMLNVGWVNTWMNKWTRCRSGAWWEGWNISNRCPAG